VADRYWVGGSGNWNNTAFWAEVSGGEGGFSVPTQNDDVFFDANSDVGSPFTVTVNVSAINTRDFIVSGLDVNMTLDRSSLSTFNLFGSISLPSSNLSLVSTSTLLLIGTSTHTIDIPLTNAFSLYQFIGTGTYTLASNISTTSQFRVDSGTFNTADYNITCDAFNMYATSTSRTVNLGSSTITCTSSSAPLSNNTTITGLTFNAGTSNFNLTGTGTLSINLQASAFHNITITNSANNGITLFGTTIVCNNLSIPGPSTTGNVRTVGVAATSMTINGTLTLSGSAPNTRIWFANTNSFSIATTATPNTTTVTAASVSLSNVDFTDIAAAGASSPWTGTNLGDAKGNTNITFPASKTVYWNLSGTRNWTENAWASSSGGTPSASNFPLPQDVAIIDDAGSAGTIAINVSRANMPSIDASSRTLSWTLQMSSTQQFYGDFILSSAVTINSTSGDHVFFGRNTQSFSTLDKSFQSRTLYLSSLNGTVNFDSNFTNVNGSFFVYRGIFNTNNNIITTGSTFQIVAGTANFGSSVINCVFFIAGGTLNTGTSQINLTAANSTLTASGRTFYDVSFTNGSLFTGEKLINGSGNTFNSLTITPPLSSYYTRFRISGNQTIGTLNVTGGDYTRRVFIYLSSENTVASLTAVTLTVGAANVDYVDFRNITIAGAASPLTGTSLGDAGSNNGITFDTPKTSYYIPTGGASNWSDNVWSNTSGGTPNAQHYPLPQDTVVIDESGASASDVLTTTGATLIVPNIDTTLRSTPLTVNFNNSTIMYILKDLIFSSAITSTSTNATALVFYSFSASQSIQSNGQAIPEIIVNGVSNTVTLLDDLTLFNSSQGDSPINLYSGTFDANDFNLNALRFTSNSSGTRTISMGSGRWTLTASATAAASAPFYIVASSLTLNRSTAEVYLTSDSIKRFWVNGSGLSLPTIVQAGRGQLDIVAGGNTFANIKNTVAQNTVANVSSAVAVEKFEVTGFDSEYVTISGAFNYTGSQEIFTDFVRVQSSTVTPSGFWIAGINSINGGGNNGWIFLTPPNPTYFVTDSFEEVSFEKRYTQYREIGQKSPRLTSGKLYGWGGNNCGQLGDGITGTICTSPIPISVDSDWRKVSSNDTAFAIKKDGTLWGWGCNNSGNIGDGTSGNSRSVPTAVLGSNTWSDVAPAVDTTAAIDTSKKLWTWGRNTCGALGTGNTVESTVSTAPARICDNDSTWASVTAGNDMFLAIKTDSTLWGWGKNIAGVIGDNSTTRKLVPVQEITRSDNWCLVAAEPTVTGFSAAIKTDGTLWTWGCGECGALGQGTTLSRSSPGQIAGGGYNWCSVAAGNSHGGALKINGTLWSWGQNVCGELGTGNTISTCSPVREITSGTDWCFISSGYLWKGAIKTSGQLWSWGQNSCGKLGDGSTLPKCSPVREFTSSTAWREVSSKGQAVHGIQFS
jgi:alpha-tubulin suppressor-like RCC1 family protein